MSLKTDNLRTELAHGRATFDKYWKGDPQVDVIFEKTFGLLDMLDSLNSSDEDSKLEHVVEMAEGLVRFVASIGVAFEVIEASDNFREKIAAPMSRLGSAITGALAPSIRLTATAIERGVNQIVKEVRKESKEAIEQGELVAKAGKKKSGGK